MKKITNSIQVFMPPTQFGFFVIRKGIKIESSKLKFSETLKSINDFPESTPLTLSLPGY